MNSVYGYALALLIGAGGAWYVEGLRWDHDVQTRAIAADKAIAANVDAVNAQLVASRAETETIRATFIDYKTGKENETSNLERAVAAGTQRLRFAGTCTPTVRAAGADAGRTGTGQPELDASARSAYFALRRGLDQQYGLLQFCRSELKKRSSQMLQK